MLERCSLPEGVAVEDIVVHVVSWYSRCRYGHCCSFDDHGSDCLGTFFCLAYACFGLMTLLAAGVFVCVGVGCVHISYAEEGGGLIVFCIFLLLHFE